MSEVIASFVAVIPDIQSAIKISGEGAARISLDTDETQLPEVIKLTLGKGMLLRVTVSAE